MPDELTDEALLAAHGAAYATARARGRTVEQALEVAQEVALRLLQRGESVRATYGAVAAWHVMTDDWRRADVRFRAAPRVAVPVEAGDGVLEDLVEAEDRARQEVAREALRGAVDRLPAGMRDALRAELEGLSRLEAAERLGARPNTIRVRACRGRAVLAGRLGGPANT